MRILLAPVGALVLTATSAAAQTPFSHKGLDGMHPGSSAAPNEQVDPASGALLVVGTDLVLPGNAGFDLRIQRVYNSAVYPDYASGSTGLEEDSWAGIGWKLHFGRIIEPDAIGAGQTQIEMGDGSRHALYHSIANNNVWTTADFWIYDRTAHTLKLPNGTIYTFDRSVFLNDRLGTVRYVTEVRDAFQNRITFTYFDSNGPPDGIAAIDQYLDAAGNQVRHITFTYDGTRKALASMSYLGHTWTYTHDAAGPAGYSVLRTVQPPAGTGWTYTYSASMPGELTGITTPAGGQVNYVYADSLRRASTLTQNSRVIANRTISGPSINGGTWTYAYGQGTNQDTTIVTCACGVQRYRFNGTGISGDFSAWSAGTMAEQTLEETDGIVRERRTFTWGRGEPLSPDPAVGVSGLWTDDAIYKALMSQVVITRGSHSWTTNYGYHASLGNYNDYGRPWFVEELGETAYQRRTIQRTFAYTFGPYILDRVASESISLQVTYGQSVGATDRFWTYNSATGFLTTQTIDEMSTSFEPTSTGNIAAVIDALGGRTTYAYSWGRSTTEQTPKVTSTYVVAPEGYVTSATSGGLTTTYEYDAALRPWFVRPPTTNPIEYVYDNINGRYVRTYRGTTMSEVQVDGFGRPVLASAGSGAPGATLLKTRASLDACGRTTFSSIPYTAGTGNAGTTTSYDLFGRVRQVSDPLGAVTSFAYDGVSVTRTDAENRQTSFEYMAFGSPSTDRLVAVTDAGGNTTRYEYDVLGTLTKVSGPNSGLTRTWTLNRHDRIGTSVQPESGTTTDLYNAVGNLTQTTDAAGQITTFQYDEDNRMISRDAPGTQDDVSVAFYPGTDRVQTLTGASVITAFEYDSAGRVNKRTDTSGGRTFISTYGYDLNDNLTSMTYPQVGPVPPTPRRTVTYHYDDANRLDWVKQNGVFFAQSLTYDDAGRPYQYTSGQATHTFTYDPAGRPARIWSTAPGGALDLTYVYDRVGNVKTITDPRPNATQSFTFDPLDRLSTANGPFGTLSWTYDPAGNRQTETGATTTTYTYNAPTQRLTSSSGATTESFSYSPIGQVLTDGTGSYTYSPTGHLATTTVSGLTVSYLYDAADTRFARTVNGATAYTLRSPNGTVLTEYGSTCGTPTWFRDYIYAGGRLLGAVKSTASTPAISVMATTTSVSEGSTTASVSFILNTPGGGSLACPVTASYETKNGTAAAGLDFTTRMGNITFPAGSVNGATQTVTVPLINDTLDEDNETFFVDVTGATGANVGTTARTTVTITDNDPLPVISIGNATVTEGSNGTVNVTVTVSLNVLSGRQVQASYGTADDSARANYDYIAASGTVTLPAATQTVTATFSVVDDRLAEVTERFFVNLSSPVNATLGTAQGIVTITDTDPLLPTWGDFNLPRDGAADAAVFTPSTRLWRFVDSYSGALGTYGPWGETTIYHDIMVPADYDGDGKTDFGVYRPYPDGVWYVQPASGAPWYAYAFGGAAGDIPVPGDYDGDGKADTAYYRPSQGYWHIYKSSTSTELIVDWGIAGATVIPTPGDYDGDDRTDTAFYYPASGYWYVVPSSTGIAQYTAWGVANSTAVKPAQGDYDGDGKTDLAYYNSADHVWYIVQSSTGNPLSLNWGVGPGDVPVAADYDGDGKTDVAFYEPNGRVFYIIRSSTWTGQYVSIPNSTAADIPVLRRPQ